MARVTGKGKSREFTGSWDCISKVIFTAIIVLVPWSSPHVALFLPRSGKRQDGEEACTKASWFRVWGWGGTEGCGLGCRTLCGSSRSLPPPLLFFSFIHPPFHSHLPSAVGYAQGWLFEEVRRRLLYLSSCRANCVSGKSVLRVTCCGTLGWRNSILCLQTSL